MHVDIPNFGEIRQPPHFSCSMWLIATASASSNLAYRPMGSDDPDLMGLPSPAVISNRIDARPEIEALINCNMSRNWAGKAAS
jgi:hypothetical protein